MSSSLLPSPVILAGWLLFGGIGFVAFTYGRKMAAWKPLMLGLALMAYPYFVSSAWAVYAIGAALCVALVVFRD